MAFEATMFNVYYYNLNPQKYPTAFANKLKFNLSKKSLYFLRQVAEWLTAQLQADLISEALG